jgi:hypothetical protein
MLWDCFTFFNELDVLRLIELWDVVDRFVLVEATRTHSGQPKPLHFAENRESFRDFADKIVAIAVDDLPDGPDPWIRERFQRDAIARGLAEARADDWILVSDVDEIPRPAALAEVKASPLLMAGFQMVFSYFKVNFVNVAGEAHVVWSVAARRSAMASPQALRSNRQRLMRPDFHAANRGKVACVPHGGWHLSYLGDEAHVRRKLAAFAHQEFNRPDIVQAVSIPDLLARGADLFGRPHYRWEVVPLSDYFPAEIATHADRYRSWIAPAPLIDPAS